MKGLQMHILDDHTVGHAAEAAYAAASAIRMCTMLCIAYTMLPFKMASWVIFWLAVPARSSEANQAHLHNIPGVVT